MRHTFTSLMFAMLMAFCVGSLSAQSLYSEDFENETPTDASNLCHAGAAYVPADGNWALGPACMIMTNGIPQLIEDAGDTHLLYNNEYSAGDEVFNTDDIDITGLSNVLIAFDARSQGDMENSGPHIDQFEMFIVVDGTETSLYQANGHVDGTNGGGNNALVTYSYEDNVAVSGSTLSLRLKVKISGSGAQEQYGIDNLAVCTDSNGDGECSACDDALAFDQTLTDQVVECLSGLPTACDATISANRGEVACGLLEERLQQSSYITATPAGSGDDWVLALFGENVGIADDHLFVPTGDGVSFTTYENGTIMVSGQVEDINDPTAILNIQTIFDSETSGADWPGGFKSDNSCGVDPMGDATTDAWNIYLLNSGLSYLTGEGSLEGTMVQLSHMPETNPGIGVPNFGFQVGQSANNRSCEFGAGGWFYYDGTFNGQSISNGTGDFAFDLTEDFNTLDPCGEGESSVTLVYTAIDLECGDALTMEQTWTRDDTTDPTFDNAPANVTISCEDPLPAVPTVTASDNCADAGFPTVSFVSIDPMGDRIDGNCPNNYTISRQWVATDCSGNTAAHTQTITVQDVTNPTITGGTNYTAECDGAGNQMELDNFLDNHAGASATDNCTADADIAWTNDFTSLSNGCGATGSATVTFTATDECGNASTVTATFTIEDNVDPNITTAASDQTVECDGGGNTAAFTAWLSNNGGAVATDACSGVTWSHNSTGLSDACGATGSETVTFTASDDCGNTSTTTATFTIEDTTAPSIDTPADNQTVECDGSGNTAALNAWLSNNGGAVASDVCGGVTWSNNYTALSDDCGATGSATVTFTATDDCNNVSTTVATFTIEDTTDPTWPTTFYYAYAACETVLDPTDPTLVPISAADDCSDVTYSIEAYQMSGGCPGTWMRVWTATDACGNSSVEAEQYLELYDNVAPTVNITCPEAYTVDADAMCAADVSTSAAGMATATATDNCDDDVDIVITHSDGETSSLCDGQYSFTRTFTATAEDDCDNETVVTCTQLITVEDNTAPTIDVAAENLTVECDGSGNTAALQAWLDDNGGAEASDNCSAITWSHSDATLSDLCAATGAVTVTFTATDDCGNFSTTSATFTIEDTTAPVISGNMTATIDCGDWACDADALEELGLFSVSEDCGDYTLSMTCTQGSGGCVTPISDYTIMVTATDECNNASTVFTQFVTLQDTEKPTLSVTAPAAYTTTLDASCMAMTDTDDAGMPTYTVDDNCDNAVDVQIDHEDGAQTPSCGSSYSFTRTFTVTATDHCMNVETVTVTQLITVNDEMDPVITCPADVIVECDGMGNASDLATFLAGASATDNCDTDVTITHDYEDGDLSDECGATGTVTVTFTATDDCDNDASCSATFTIVDTTAPAMGIAASPTTVECDGMGNAEELQAWLGNNGGAMASDDCSAVTWYNNYECALDAGDFLTYNQGSLGAANSEAGSDYLDANFATVFPNGVTVGCGEGYELNFTTADAVDTYLPCTGGAQDLVLTYGGTNPTEAAVDPTCWDNAFVSHLLTAKINVAFDAANAAYSASDFPVTGLIRTSGPLAGYSLGEIIALGDQVLGGCSSEFTPNQLRKALRDYNRNFDNGVNLGRYQLPGCDNSVTLSNGCGATGAVTVTFTAVDECGNSTSTSSTFTIEDTLGPDFAGSSADYTISCDDYSATTQYAVMAADDCSEATITIESNADVSGNGCAGTIYRVYKAVDACNNETTFGQTIALTDDTPPTVTITCPADYSADANATCSNDLSESTTGSATYTASDNCDNNLTEVLNYTDGERTYTCDGATEGSFTFVRTWKITVTDHCSNVTVETCDQNITITDNSAPSTPVITCPDDATVYLDANCTTDASATVTGEATATATDNCDSEVTYTITHSDGAPVYSCDQSEICMEELYSEDFEDETPANAANLCHDATPYVPADNNWSLGPACMILTNGIPQLIEDAGDTHLLYNNEYSAGDEVFNSADIDITGLSTVRIAFDARSQGDMESSGPYLDQFEMFIVVDGTETSLYQANGHVDGTSGGGNSALVTHSFEDNVTVSGSTMSLRLKVKISGSGAQEQYGIDNLSICSVDDQAQGSYSFVRTWTAAATDNCDNTSAASTCEQTITVVDNLAPVLSCADMTVECDGAGNEADLASFLASATATDNCDSDVTITHDFTTLSDLCAETGAATVTFTAEDDCGNESTCTATFTIEDTTAPAAPTISGPADAQVYLDANCSTDASTAVTGEATATSSDACDAAPSVSVTHSDSEPTYSCTGDDATLEGSYTFVRTFTATATDACSNTSSASTYAQTITVTDNVKPSITCPENTTVECDGAGNAQALATFLAGATATDNCDTDVAITHDYAAGSITGGCSAYTGSVTVTFTATDDCGNSESCSATFTIQDITSPSITASNEVSIACDEYNANTAYSYSATDACSNVTTTIVDVEQSGACAGEYERTYTAEDECGNESTFVQIVKLTDDVAPTFNISCPENTTLYTDASCEADDSEATLGSATYSDVDDNCDNEVTMNVSSDDVVTPGCTGSYTIVRTWTITGTDHCNNVTTKTCSQTITVLDETAPTIQSPAMDSEVECDGSGNSAAFQTWLGNNAGAAATDACSGVTWSNNYVDGDLSDECGATGSVTVIFTATDACDNASTTSATFTIVDETDPALSVTWPADANLMQNATCDIATGTDALGMATATATDACSNDDVAIEISSEDGATTYTCTGDDDLLEGSYTFDRVWTVTATDLCNNVTTQEHTQTIVVTDNMAPQFTETCDIMNEGTVGVCCVDNVGTVTIPDACDVEAADNCDTDVTITFSETYVGDFAPTSTVASFCASSTPEAYADGLSCNFKDPHSFVLFGLEGENVYFTSVGSGTVAQNVDGTWTLTQTLTNAENTGGMDISVTYGEAYSWTEWMNQSFPTGYKRDCGVLVDDHENWDYRIMESGSATGTGIYSGYSLMLAHAPANNYYAMQIGLGANNQNDNYGYSAWFMATGTMNTGTDGEQAVFFSGDLFGDLDCCLPWSIDRTYVAVDDCGNDNTFSYSVSVNGEDCADGALTNVSGSQNGDHTPVILGGAGDVLTGKTPIRVTNLQPNPTNDLSLLGFSVTQNMRLRVDMYTMDGLLVTELFDGIASPNVNHTLDIEADDLESGMYQIRLSSSQYLVVKKLLVTE